ncbi:MAG: glutamate--tRNA ligase [Spirochaetota bacterium]|nr:MAG: glutamate--tRNA ligase [Spirochaetota bacterium]
MDRVRTRFAPSPTGFLHIGGMRTALFSFLFARNNNGDFILRIEDTDRSRIVEGALDDIMDSLRWAGIIWDEGPDIGGPYSPYMQSERKTIYQEHAQQLVESGKAYRCYCTPERLKQLRTEHGRQGYDRYCRNLSDDEKQSRDEARDTHVIRLKIPLNDETAFRDEIRGEIVTKNEDIDDFVLLKSDGFPTYHLANVVDDHLMQINYVIRGDEWISSTPKHVLLYNAFEWTHPKFAHVPVILAKEGGKLSKRHGATMVREFINRGYLSDAFINFIALLGWSLDDKSEFFEMHELIKHFDLNKVNKASSVFSYEKLDWFNGMYIRKKSIEQLYELILPYLIKGGFIAKEDPDQDKDYILEIIPLIQERLKYLGDIENHVWFFFDKHFEVRQTDALIPKKLSKNDAVRILEETARAIEGLKVFSEEDIENCLRGLVESIGFKAGQVFMTIRVAITGSSVSPGLFETIRVLGKNRVQSRINHALSLLKSEQTS